MASSAPYSQANPAATITRIRFVTLIGMVFNLLLVISKVLGGLFFGSQALLADAFHSLSDLITDLAVIFGVKYWTAPPDADHPYGHGKIETLISAFIGLALTIVACGLVWDAVKTLRASAEGRPGVLAFGIALFSIASKEWLFRWTRREAKKLGSKAMEANAWHHRSDALSSIPAATAIALAYFFPELHFVDPLGAILVSGFILHAAWKITKPTILELSDAGVSLSAKEKIHNLVMTIPGICAAHAIRGRSIGGVIFADLHIKVASELTVQEGHLISHQARQILQESDLNIVDVVIHLEPFETLQNKSPATSNLD